MEIFFTVVVHVVILVSVLPVALAQQYPYFCCESSWVCQRSRGCKFIVWYHCDEGIEAKEVRALEKDGVVGWRSANQRCKCMLSSDVRAKIRF